jgi:hypothetical protein
MVFPLQFFFALRVSVAATAGGSGLVFLLVALAEELHLAFTG